MEKNYINQVLSDEARELDLYLDQYRQCRHSIKMLQDQKKDIEYDMQHPLSGMGYDGMPKGNKTSSGAAALPLKLDSIEHRLEQSINRAADMMQKIFSVISQLPDESDERLILEYKYINNQSLRTIGERLGMSKSSVKRKWKRGLNTLAEKEEIKKLLIEWRRAKDAEYRKRIGID